MDKSCRGLVYNELGKCWTPKAGQLGEFGWTPKAGQLGEFGWSTGRAGRFELFLKYQQLPTNVPLF